MIFAPATPDLSLADGFPEFERSLAARPPKNILLVARDHLGDLVNTTGAIASITRRFPDARISVEAGAGAIAVLDGFPGIAELLPRRRKQGLPEKLLALRERRRARYDLALLLDCSNQKALMASLAKIPRIVGVRRDKYRSRYAASLPEHRAGHDLLETLARALALVGAELDLQPRLYPQAAHLEEAQRIVPEPGHCIGVFVGASETWKRWPLERFVTTMHRLEASGRPCMAFTGPAEAFLRDRLDGVTLAPAIRHPLALAATIGRLRGVLTVDSGPAHVAAAMQTPSVVLFGPTPPHRYAPNSDVATIVWKAMPCDRYRGVCGDEPCSLRCMHAIEVDEVVAAVCALPKRTA